MAIGDLAGRVRSGEMRSSKDDSLAGFSQGSEQTRWEVGEGGVVERATATHLYNTKCKSVCAWRADVWLEHSNVWVVMC